MMLSDGDRRILRALQADATLSLKALAERVAMSTSTVWRRVQELEAAGIITGRVTLLDPEQLGLPVCTLINVNVRTQTAAARAALEAFADAHDHVLQCYAVTGSHDYILIVRSRTVKDYETFLMDELLAHPSVASAQSQLILRQCKNATALPV